MHNHVIQMNIITRIQFKYAINRAFAILDIGWRLACKAAFKVNLPGYKQQKVYADIISVVLGVKPAFLVDCAQTTGEKCQVLLTEICYQTSHEGEISTQGTQTDLGSYHCIFQNCCIITLNDDVLLVNLAAQRSLSSSHIDEANGDWPYYVNIGRGQTCPHTLRKSDSKHQYIEGMYAKLCDELESAIKKTNSRDSQRESYVLDLPSQQEETGGKEITSSYCTYYIPCKCGKAVTTARGIDSLNQNQSINLCTLFGRLLGYPLVYWFDPGTGYSLEMVDLVCYTVTVRKRQDSHQHKHYIDIFQQDRQLYSFSVPKCLPAAVDKVVTSWFQKVESLASASGLDVHLTRETVCLPSVSL